jgi:hypothetical protein
MRAHFAAAAAALLVGTSIAGTSIALAAPVGRLAPKDVETTFFTGKPFTASTPSNVKFKMVFKPDGTMTRESLGKPGKSGKSSAKSSVGTVTEGTWKLSQDGFCSSWKGAKENCYRVHENGSNKWAIVSGSQAVAYWSK